MTAKKEKKVKNPEMPKAKPKDILENAEIETINLTEIEQDNCKFQFRLSEGIIGLKQSIETEGQLVPVILRGNLPKYEIVDGHRRVKTLAKLGWTTVKAIVHRDMSEEEAYKLSIVENIKRKSFTAMDIANAVWTLKRMGKSDDDLMKEFNIQDRQLRRYRELLNFKAPIQNALSAGVIKMSHAKILNDHEIDTINEYIEKMKKEVISARKLKTALNKNKSRKRKSNYFQETGYGFRLYELRYYREDATPEKRAEIRKALLEVLEILEETSADSNLVESTSADSNLVESTSADSNLVESTSADSRFDEETSAESNSDETL